MWYPMEYCTIGQYNSQKLFPRSVCNIPAVSSGTGTCVQANIDSFWNIFSNGLVKNMTLPFNGFAYVLSQRFLLENELQESVVTDARFSNVQKSNHQSCYTRRDLSFSYPHFVRKTVKFG